MATLRRLDDREDTGLGRADGVLDDDASLEVFDIRSEDMASVISVFEDQKRGA